MSLFSPGRGECMAARLAKGPSGLVESKEKASGLKALLQGVAGGGGESVNRVTEAAFTCLNARLPYAGSPRPPPAPSRHAAGRRTLP